MAWLEDKIRPYGESRHWLREVFGIAMIVLLMAVAMIAWDGVDGGDGGYIKRLLTERFLSDIPGQMASSCTLLAMGFLLALRCGAIDLSVWTVAGLGGLIAARAINAGISPAAAMALAGAAGLAIGAFNGAMVIMAKIPSVVITLLVAIVIAFVSQAAADSLEVKVADDTFDIWRMSQKVPVNADGEPVDADEAVAVQVAAIPLQVTRMLIVAGFYAAVMLVLLLLDTISHHGVRADRRISLFVAMCTSGMLAAVGGTMWLIDYSAAPVPTRIIGDMRIIAAALLAGGLLFAGRGRTMLAGISLPAAMLIATAWQQDVWAMEIRGYAFQLLILAGMVIVAHIAVIELAEPSGIKMTPRIAAVIFCVAGIAVVAMAADAADVTRHGLFHIIGCCVWAVGAMMLLAVKIVAGRRLKLHPADN